MNPSNLDDEFGFEPEDSIAVQEDVQTPTEESIATDEDFGFEPEKEKVGPLKSIGYGAAEAVLAPASILEAKNKIIDPAVKTLISKIISDDNPLQSLANELVTGYIPNPNQLIKAVFGFDPIEKATGSKDLKKDIIERFTGKKTDSETPAGDIMSQFPESEDETSRRLRTGTTAAISAIPFGIPGILMGLVGSQAGQTVREVYGKEGKFDNFGAGEIAAIAADVGAGGVTGVLTSLFKRLPQSLRNLTNEVPRIFRNEQGLLQKSAVKNTLQGEKNALQEVIDSFSRNQINQFEQEASNISSNRYTELTQSNASAIKQTTENMHRQGVLSTISPIAATPEQGGAAIQQTANTIFQENVIEAERALYRRAAEAGERTSGRAPEALEMAKNLRQDLLKNTPSGEQNPVVNYLNGLISDLETVIPASRTEASSLVDQYGKPLIEAVETPASTIPTIKTGTELVDAIQRGNYAVNYASETRQQSHRLKPIIDKLRQETAYVLDQNPQARQLYQEANNLHAENAEIWGTNFMKDVRFNENPEKIVGKLRSPSNMRNFKQGINIPMIQALGERLVIEQMTESGGAQANRTAINKLAPELSPTAQEASQNLINAKDKLTTEGGRAAIRNTILTDAAQSVNTGKRPKQILEIMKTPKGYQIVRESLNTTPESRQLFNSFERLFVEDIISSITNQEGLIDFKKAQNIFKNDDVRNVVRLIGGEDLVTRFRNLQTYANNFERNLALYKTPEAQSLFKQIGKNAKSAGVLGAVLHSLHVPYGIIAGLFAAAGVGKAGKAISNATWKKIMQNPRAVKILETVSTTDKIEILKKELPRLIQEIEKTNTSD